MDSARSRARPTLYDLVCRPRGWKFSRPIGSGVPCNPRVIELDGLIVDMSIQCVCPLWTYSPFITKAGLHTYLSETLGLLNCSILDPSEHWWNLVADGHCSPEPLPDEWETICTRCMSENRPVHFDDEDRSCNHGLLYICHRCGFRIPLSLPDAATTILAGPCGNDLVCVFVSATTPTIIKRVDEMYSVF